MLTKELIRTRVSNRTITPLFIDTSKKNLLDIAEKLLAIYDTSMALTRTEIDQGVMGIVNSVREIKVAKGLNKLLLDRSEFSHGGEYDHRAFRQELFAIGSSLLRERHSFTEYKSAIESTFSDRIDQLSNIYSDHPECEILIAIRPLTASQLLDLYNISLVQSLLLQCDSIDLTVSEPNSASMRKLFASMRFFRLLAECQPSRNSVSELQLKIAGPGSGLDSYQKYGMLLASFFPSLVSLKTWSLSAQIPDQSGPLNLTIDSSMGLKTRNRGTYTPPEIALFKKDFEQKSGAWKIEELPSFATIHDGTTIFPDFEFTHESGVTVSLELFHRWHGNQCIRRLETLEKQQDSNIAVGIDRSIARKGDLAERVKKSGFFSAHGFLYSDFPAVTSVRKVLDSFL